MTSNYNYNNQNRLLTHVINTNPSINKPSLNSNDLVNRANSTELVYKSGIIDTLYVVNDSVFAIVRKNYAPEFFSNGDQKDHGTGWFNTSDGVPPENLTIPELAIKTNISAINNVVYRYIGKPCVVTVKGGVGVYANVSLGGDYLTIFPTKLLMDVRGALGAELNLFSDRGKQLLKDNGFTDEEINNLEALKYETTHTEKTVTFKDEAVWGRDTSTLGTNQLEVVPTDIINGLNKLTLKTRDCHKPTRLFSGK